VLEPFDEFSAISLCLPPPLRHQSQLNCMMKGYLVALALVLASASQVLAQPPIIILPGA
jgi:hypothetical protein